MNDRLTIAAMLLATTAQRRPVNGDDVLSATKCADDLIRAEAGFDSSIVVGTGFKCSSPFFYPSRMIGVDVAAGESETVAVQVVPTGLPTEYVGDFAFKVGDRCHCVDASTRVIVSSSTDGVKYRQGRGKPDQWIGGQYALFDRAGVMRNGEYVAILTSTPPAPVLPTVYYGDFAFEAGDRCECRDGEPRIVVQNGMYTTPGVNGELALRGSLNDVHFYGAIVYRDGKPVAVLSGDPEAFRLQVGDVVIIPDVCGRIITHADPLAWGSESAFESEINEDNQEFARQLRKGAVWRNGELVREAVV